VALLLSLLAATATCTQLVGVEEAQPYVADGGASVALPTCPGSNASCRGALCDTDLATNNDHCGGCGVRCETLNGGAACKAGKCVVACAPGFGDCDQNRLNGCETNLGSDPHSCGACGHDCAGTDCTQGVCAPAFIGVASANVTSLDTDGVRVFAGSVSRVDSIPVAGGPTTQVWSGNSLAQLAANGRFLYVMHSLSGDAGPLELDEVSRNGFGSRCVARMATGRRMSAAAAGAIWGAGISDAGGAPLLSESLYDASCANPAVLDGGDAGDAGDAGVVADVPPASIGVALDGKMGDGVLVDGATAYATILDSPISATGALARVELASGAATIHVPLVRPSVDGSRSLAVDATHLYYVDAQIFVRRVPKAGCPAGTTCVEDVFAEGFGTILALVVDAQNLYVLAQDGSTTYLQVISKANPSAQRHIAGDVRTLSGDVVLGDTFVFWAIGQKVYRIPR
jgi:hypothetical protein